MDFVGFTACLLRSANICWLCSRPLSSKTTTAIFSLSMALSSSHACLMAEQRCWPSLTIILALDGMRMNPVLPCESLGGAGSNRMDRSTETVTAENT